MPWYFVEVTDIERIKNQLVAEIDRIGVEIDEAVSKTAWGVFKLLLELPDDMFEQALPDLPPDHRPHLLDDDDE